jgi:restriction endonuclease S subunit
MWSSEISTQTLLESNRWTVSFFANPERNTSSIYPLIQIGDLCNERRGAEDPQQLGDVLINYIGLENIRPQTGELIDFQPRFAITVKSRSKKFESNDILFGRLRPELNKVYLVNDEIKSGLCSGEFIVLTPNGEYVTPRYLRYLLASEFVTRFASKYKVGSSLPRIAQQDLLGLRIPVPPIDIQQRLDIELQIYERELHELRTRLQILPNDVTGKILSVLGCNDVDVEVLSPC